MLYLHLAAAACFPVLGPVVLYCMLLVRSARRGRILAVKLNLFCYNSHPEKKFSARCIEATAMKDSSE